jgi:hypothetical protein
MRYVLKKIRRVIVNDTVTKKHKFTIVEIKQAGIKNGQDTIWAEGASGVRLAGFDQNKTSGFSFTSGVVTTGIIEAQVGGSRVEVSNGTKIKFREEITISDSATTVTLAHKASGTAGSEILWIYKEDQTGEPGEAFAQAATASATEFSYAAATKVLTLPTGVFSDGDVVCIDYFPTFSKYGEIANEADKFSYTGEVFIDAWWTDVSTKADVPLQVYSPAGKVSGIMDLAFGDAVATQSVEIEALSELYAGKQKTLWIMRDYDLNDIVDT